MMTIATAALRRRVGQRVAELEDAVAERRERSVALARESATEAPTLADVAPLLDRLPILAISLDTAPQRELRTLFDALQLDVVYQPAEGAADVAVTLYNGGRDTGATAAKMRAEDWSAPPALHNANLSTDLSGDVLSLASMHAKVRRDGYRK
jgi:hypothetical protein